MIPDCPEFVTINLLQCEDCKKIHIHPKDKTNKCIACKYKEEINNMKLPNIEWTYPKDIRFQNPPYETCELCYALRSTILIFYDKETLRYVCYDCDERHNQLKKEWKVYYIILDSIVNFWN